MRPVTLTCALVFSAASSSFAFDVAHGSARSRGEIDWMGHPTKLIGDGSLEVGQAFPRVRLIDAHMREVTVGGPGRVRVINVVPSIDTEVCDAQTRALDGTPELGAEVERIVVSRDLPYALERFTDTAKLTRTRVLSDYRYRELGQKGGLEIERNGLLARAIVVLDRRGVIRQLQITPHIYELPDMGAAFKAAGAWGRKKGFR